MSEKTNIDSSIENKLSGGSKNVQSELALLPSYGKIYPQSSPLHNRKDIPIKIMSAAEEDILNNRAYLKQRIALDKLLEAVMIDKTIDLNEMIVGDKNAILLFVRILGYGSEYSVDNIKCDNCDKNFKTTIDLSTIKIKDMSDVDPVENGVNRFEFTLPSSKRKVYFHLLTNKDDTEISKSEEGKKKVGIVAAAPITNQLYHQIDAIEGVEEKDKMFFIKSMRALDSRELRNYIESITPGPNMEQELKCPYCEDEREYTIPIGAGFFWPRR